MSIQKLKVLFLLIPILLISFGFVELSFKKTIFIDTQAQCCNNQLCQYPNILCTDKSTIQFFVHPGSNECTQDYNITCGECVIYSAANQVCPVQKYNSCKKADGSCYGWCNGIWVLDK